MVGRGHKIITSRWTDVSGLRMHARVAVDVAPGAPAIVLFHGVGVASSSFVPTMERLAPNFRVFAVDLPGFGRSDKPARVLRIGELADALAAWMRAEGLERPHVLGNAVGCQIAADFAARYPERVERLILTGPTMDPRARSAWKQIARRLRNARYERISQVPISVRDYWQAGARRLMGTIRYALEDRIKEKLPLVQAPTLVVRGGNDPLAPQRWAEEAARLLPRGRLAPILGAGHTVNYNAPKELARLVRAFLRGDDAPWRSRTRRSQKRTGIAIALGLLAILLAALMRPGPVVRWLARRYPEVLFFLQTGEPLVALTIDDSPHPDLTPRILDALAEHGAHATFFLIGERIPGNEAIVQRIVDEGHELGNHLMTNAPSILVPPAAFARQLRQTHDLLAPFGPVRWFRPGSAFYNRRMLDQIHAHGYRCALGSAYAYDPQVRSTWYVTRHILRDTCPGSVVALHDGAGCGDRTVAVLRNVLPRWQRLGYRVVTLSELAEEEPGAPRVLPAQPAPGG